MKNVAELNAALINVFKKLDTGEMDLKLAAELNNTAGKIMNVHKLTLAYHALRGEAPSIPFLAAPVDWHNDAGKARRNQVEGDDAPTLPASKHLTVSKTKQ